MKKIVLLSVCLLFLLPATPSLARKKGIRLGVLRFTNNTHASWWTTTAGSELQDMLIAELAGIKCFKVLERKELGAVLREQDLGRSGRISKRTRARIGKVTGAKYLVAATVSAFEESTSGGRGGFSFKGIHIGGKRKRAYIAVDLKVIDVDTGEIADVRTVEATSKSGGLNLGIFRGDFGGTLGGHKKTPTGKAIRACVMEIAEYLKCSLCEGPHSPCMEEYNAKESRRREKTKGSIDLE